MFYGHTCQYLAEFAKKHLWHLTIETSTLCPPPFPTCKYCKHHLLHEQPFYHTSERSENTALTIILFLILQFLWRHHVHQHQHLGWGSCWLYLVYVQTRDLDLYRGLCLLQMPQYGRLIRLRKTKLQIPTRSFTDWATRTSRAAIIIVVLTFCAFLAPTLALCTISFLSPSCMPLRPAHACREYSKIS